MVRYGVSWLDVSRVVVLAVGMLRPTTDRGLAHYSQLTPGIYALLSYKRELGRFDAEDQPPPAPTKRSSSTYPAHVGCLAIS